MTLISEKYRMLNRQLHHGPRGFGGSGFRWVSQLHLMVIETDARSILDYGCGEETLWDAYATEHPCRFGGILYHGYDPGIIGRDEPPRSADLVACTDVLEHIEPEFLDNVLEHIKQLARKGIFLNIATHLANKTLPDGRNTHLIVQPKEWWAEKIQTVFGEQWDIGFPKSKRWKDFHVFMVRKATR